MGVNVVHNDETNFNCLCVPELLSTEMYRFRNRGIGGEVRGVCECVSVCCEVRTECERCEWSQLGSSSPSPHRMMDLSQKVHNVLSSSTFQTFSSTVLHLQISDLIISYLKSRSCVLNTFSLTAVLASEISHSLRCDELCYKTYQLLNYYY